MHCLLCSVVFLAACVKPAPDSEQPEPQKPEAAQALELPPGYDHHSFANPNEAHLTHVSLDLTADFAQQILKGTATLTVQRVAPAAAMVVLDTRALDIQDVQVRQTDGSWRQTWYELSPADPNLGAALRVELPGEGDQFVVRVRYRTSPAASGLQWLTPVQTAGKRHPFLFTQSQAIHARSWIPLQDTPAVRVTYDAVVRTPPELLAVMSASNELNTPRDGVYEFSMPQPIPSYLIALGIGDLVFEPMGQRTGVYAEPSLVAAAANEFAETEQMLIATEQMYGPYRWGRYDLLILPPSFPFGGMENPRLSFITPTVIAGDRSLVSLIAHELAHSWSGNLVTNAAWRDLWLNEGFTSYLEARIMEEIYGERRASMENVLGYQKVMQQIEELPDSAEILAIDLRGKDPDDVFSNIPYTKGQLFLTTLEHAYGRDRFDAFLQQYFDAFAFRSITTEVFLEYLEKNLLDAYPGVMDMEAIRTWVYKPGMPSNVVVPESDAFERVAAQSADWLAGEVKASDIRTGQWTVHEWLYFLNNLPARLGSDQLNELDTAFTLTQSANNEIAHSWLLIAVRNDYEPAYERLEKYLVSIGRRKLITPLYEELVKSDKGAAFARRVYAVARPGYHPLAVRTVDGILAGD
ncbi:MAG: M1 family metallopeptidase [Gammaproteobacteria bacterium]|nr:M1 family metallopeptidase [Gammaproteobacteria bacterium]NNF61373.1 M1 family metallopeptidase [Gammaproteobacteria bacterium]